MLSLTPFFRAGILAASMTLNLTSHLHAADLSLAEHLGHGPNDKLLIVNGDDVAMSHAANAATIDAMENGLMTSATIMVPCPWFPEIAAYAKAHPGADFGLHLTHTSEWKKYRWGPVAGRGAVPGLVDPEGYLWRDVPLLYLNSNPEEAEIEARAQIEKALAAGIDVTHLDSHMGALHYHPGYHQVYRKLANEYNLPVRMGSQETLAQAGYPQIRAELAADGVIFSDYLIHGDRREGETIDDYWRRQLRQLKPGVTELYIHAALPTDEMKEITGSWQTRAREYGLFRNDPSIRQIIEEENIRLIGYRELRDLQRNKK